MRRYIFELKNTSWFKGKYSANNKICAVWTRQTWRKRSTKSCNLTSFGRWGKRVKAHSFPKPAWWAVSRIEGRALVTWPQVHRCSFESCWCLLEHQPSEGQRGKGTQTTECACSLLRVLCMYQHFKSFKQPSVKQGLLSYPLYRWGNWGRRTLSDLSMVAKPMNGKARERTQVPEFKSLTTRKYHVLLVTNVCLEMVILSSTLLRCNLRSKKGTDFKWAVVWVSANVHTLNKTQNISVHPEFSLMLLGWQSLSPRPLRSQVCFRLSRPGGIPSRLSHTRNQTEGTSLRLASFTQLGADYFLLLQVPEDGSLLLTRHIPWVVQSPVDAGVVSSFWRWIKQVCLGVYFIFSSLG